MSDTHKTESLHDQIMRLPCTPPKDANVNQMLAYKSGHRDARHAAAELAAAHEVEQAAPVAVPEEALELLRIWKTWLGPYRDACDTVGQMLWDRIDAVLAAAPTPPAGPWESPCTPPAQPVAVPDELRAKAEKFVISRRKAAEFDRVAESELEDEDADEAQACAVQAFFHEEAAALVEQLLSAAPTPPARQPDAVSGLVNALERYTAFAATRRDELGELSREMEDVDAFACDALAKYRATPAQQSQCELLKALEGCVEHMEWSTDQGKAACSAARAAIANASDSTAAPGPQRKFSGPGYLEQTGYIPAGSAAEREGNGHE